MRPLCGVKERGLADSKKRAARGEGSRISNGMAKIAKLLGNRRKLALARLKNTS